MNEQKFEDSSKLNKIKNLIEAYDEFIKKNDYENALPIIKKLVETRGQIDDWIACAMCQTYLGHHYDAIESFTVIVDIDDTNVDVWINLGILLSKIGMYDDALICFDYVAELNIEPGSLKALDLLINMAIVLDNLQRYEESEALFNHIYKAKPNFACIWLDRGLSLCKNKRYDEALFLFDQALLIEPSHENILINKGLVLSDLKRSEEALLSFDKSLEINNKNSKVWLYKGTLLSELKLYNDALDAFDKSLELGNQSYSLLVNYAVILLALKYWEKGTGALSIAIESLSSANEFDEQLTVKIVSNLLNGSNGRSEWQLPIQMLLELYDKYSISYKLATGLKKSITRIVSLIFDEEKVNDWRDIWRELTISRPEFQTSLRLLDTAVNYRETKGSPLIYLGLSKEEENLFKSLLGVEQSPEPLDESNLIFDAGFVALSGYRFLGRGVVCFFGEKPEYLPLQENMPDDIIMLVNEYEPDREFIVVPSNHNLAMLLEFDEIGMKVSSSLTEKEYKQRLEKVFESLIQQGLNKNLVSNLQEVALEFRGVDLNSKSYPPEMLSFFQNLSEETILGNTELLVNFFNNNL